MIDIPLKTIGVDAEDGMVRLVIGAGTENTRSLYVSPVAAGAAAYRAWTASQFHRPARMPYQVVVPDIHGQNHCVSGTLEEVRAFSRCLSDVLTERELVR